MPRYVFQQSMIWEGSGDKVDPTGQKVSKKGKDEAKARRQLPEPGMGRNWVLIEIK